MGDSVGCTVGGADNNGEGFMVGSDDRDGETVTAEGFSVVPGVEDGWTEVDGCGDDEGIGEGRDENDGWGEGSGEGDGGGDFDGNEVRSVSS